MEITLKQLKSLLRTLEEGGVSEFEYQDEKYRMRLKVGHSATAVVPVAHAAPAAQPEAASQSASGTEDEPGVVYITSPFVGTFYRAPSPEAEPFCEVGSAVKKGHTLCIVEAMKLMNEIESEQDGTILEILVDNGQSVEFGQKLFKLKTA
jgi:acetyl-CoA carboxylase biotin carboxyl carrier protein